MLGIEASKRRFAAYHYETSRYLRVKRLARILNAVMSSKSFYNVIIYVAIAVLCWSSPILNGN